MRPLATKCSHGWSIFFGLRKHRLSVFLEIDHRNCLVSNLDRDEWRLRRIFHRKSFPNGGFSDGNGCTCGSNYLVISFFQRLCGQWTGPIPLVSWLVLESSASRSWNICSGKICNFDGQNHVLGGDSTIFRADSSKFPGWDTPASNGIIISSFKLLFCNPPQFGNEATHPYGKVWWNSETWYIMCNIQYNIILYI